MTATTLTGQLGLEQSLAKRWLRRGPVPLGVWQWLAGRHAQPVGLPWEPGPLLRKALEELAASLGQYSIAREQAALDQCLETVSQLCLAVHTLGRGPALACQHQMLAASLVPLYRGLAKGSVPEITSVMKRQLADTLTAACFIQEFGAELSELLASGLSSGQSPYAILKKTLAVDLERVAQILLSTGQRWDGQSVQQLDERIRTEVQIDWRPAWGAPAVLWRLAGEVIAQRSDFVVPRDWINAAVPWHEVSEHWMDVVHAMEHSTGSPQATASATPQETHQAETQPAAQAVEGTSPTARAVVAASCLQHACVVDPQSDGASAHAVSKLLLEIEIAETVDSLVQASRSATGRAVGNRSDASHAPPAARQRRDETLSPKVLISEIHSHNDPAFVAVVRRQLGMCRTDERTMSLLAVCVQPDGEESHMPTLQSLGLATWQQDLVNWMSEHPETHDLYAFLSNQGELIVSLMDIERNSATSLLRQGLLEVLAGQTGEENAPLLNRAAQPARYHGGIGSVSSPTAGLGPEQLIEATYRCLAAAQRHGKASIKSIEVF